MKSKSCVIIQIKLLRSKFFWHVFNFGAFWKVFCPYLFETAMLLGLFPLFSKTSAILNIDAIKEGVSITYDSIDSDYV